MPFFEGLVFASDTDPSFWKAFVLHAPEAKSSLLTLFFDVYITPSGHNFKDVQTKAVSELVKKLCPTVEKRLKPRKTSELLAEVCIDWQSASSFVLPNVIPVDGLEKELGSIFKKIDIGYRFLLKLTFIAPPSGISYRKVKSESGETGDYKTTTATEPLFPKIQEAKPISISDCFRIVEKSRFISFSHQKHIFELKLTREAVLRGFPPNRAWQLLVNELISSSFEQLQEKRPVNLQIMAGPFKAAIFCPWDNDHDAVISQISALLWTLVIEGQRKGTLTLIFFEKGKRYEDIDDISETVQNYMEIIRPYFRFEGNGYEEQLAAISNSTLPEEMPCSYSSSTFSSNEISRESYESHCVARSFLVSLIGQPKTYASAVMELTKRQLPRALALFGNEVLVGYRLKQKDGKGEVHVPFTEPENLTERNITAAGSFKGHKEFIAMVVFLGPHQNRASRLVDEIVQFKRKMAPDANGNVSRRVSNGSGPKSPPMEMNGNVIRALDNLSKSLPQNGISKK